MAGWIGAVLLCETSQVRGEVSGVNERVWRKLLNSCRQMNEFHALDGLLSFVVDVSLEVFDAGWGVVYMGEEPGALEVRMGRAHEDRTLAEVEARINPVLLARILAAEGPCTYTAFPEIAAATGVLPMPPGIDAPGMVLGLPLRAHGETLGVVCLAWDEVTYEPDAELEQFCMIQFSQAVQNRLLSDRVQRSEDRRHLIDDDANAGGVIDRETALAQAHSRMLLMRTVDVELTRQLDVDYVLTIALDSAMRLSHAETGLIGLMEEGRLVVRQAVGHYEQAGIMSFADEDGIIGRVIQQLEAELVLDVVDDPDYLAIIPETRAKMVLPLISQDRLMGIINLETSQPDNFTTDAYEYLRILAGRVAVALDNARLFEVERRERHIEHMLRQAAQSLGESLELRDVMERILGNLREVVAFDSASVLQLSLADDALEIMACCGFDDPEHVVGLTFPVVDDDPLQRPLRDHQPLHVVDVNHYEHFVVHPIEGVTVRTWLSVPLVLRDEVIGVVTLDRYQVDAFSDHEIDLISTFATHAAIAMGNARSFEREKQRRQVEEMMRISAEMLNQTLDLDDVLARVMIQIETVVPCDTTSIQHLQGDFLEIIAAHGFEDPEQVMGQRFPVIEEMVQDMLESHLPVHITDVDMYPHFVRYKQANPQIQLRTWLGVPLIARGQFIGRITLDRWYEVNPFTEDEIELAIAFANHAAIALKNAELYHQQEMYSASLEHALHEREKLIDELDAFAHTVAHDLKNPLSIVLAYAELLRAEATAMLSPEEIVEFSDEIFRSAEKMHSIIDALLVLAGVRQMGEVTVSPLDMGAIVGGVCRRLDRVIRQHDADIVIAEAWPAVMGYAPWVEEVWANYISNALKYGDDPPQVELGASDLQNGYVRFWVRDNGRGIAPDDQAQLFTPFTRLSQVRTIEGHGLGLSIVQRIVERLGGEVSVDSVVGQGSTFGFTLPVAGAETPQINNS